MKTLYFIFIFCLAIGKTAIGQSFAFISDTQEPMAIETILLKTERNKEAANLLLSDMSTMTHQAVFFLGDLVAAGSSNKAWERIDNFLYNMQQQNTPVYAIYGNHEYMMSQGEGEKNFSRRFPTIPNTGYVVVQDSTAIVLFNSNFSKLSKDKQQAQIRWYERSMDSLNRDNGVKFIIVCCHHSPYTNSNVVSPEKKVQELYVPAYTSTPKAALFLSGHSHHLEYFDIYRKNFMVIGGGGGLWQPYKKEGKRDYADLLEEAKKPRYFYLQVNRVGNQLQVSARGFTMDQFGVFKDYPITTIPYSTTIAPSVSSPF